jgi:protein TonB
VATPAASRLAQPRADPPSTGAPTGGQAGTASRADEEPTPIARVAPRYPGRARLAGIEGAVLVELTVAPDGSVADARVVEAHPPGVFEVAVLKALRQWRFAPRGDGGTRTAHRARQTVQFRLDD